MASELLPKSVTPRRASKLGRPSEGTLPILHGSHSNSPTSQLPILLRGHSDPLTPQMQGCQGRLRHFTGSPTNHEIHKCSLYIRTGDFTLRFSPSEHHSLLSDRHHPIAGDSKARSRPYSEGSSQPERETGICVHCRLKQAHKTAKGRCRT